MITDKQLEELGFINDEFSTSPYDGKFNLFKKQIDNEHVILGNDITDIYLIKEGNFIIIKRHQISSYLDNKEIVFKGKCRDIDFLRLILEAVI